MSDARQPSSSDVRRVRARWSAATAVVLLAALAAACGSGGSVGAAAPTPTPVETPAATPTPTDAPTPPAVVELPPMLLDPSGTVSGYATGVNVREWISVVSFGPAGAGTSVVLPPDAGREAGPLPVPGCPLGAASPECALGDARLALVGESDWVSGSSEVETPSNPAQFPTAFGPDGEVALLLECCVGPPNVGDILPLPGARFVAMLKEPDPEIPGAIIDRPILWRSPGSVFERLPLTGFSRGATAGGGDVEGRIAGQGVDPVLAIVWVPEGDGFDVVVLPVPGGTSLAGANDVDGGRVVGWSNTRAVIWEPVGSTWIPRVLPAPDGTNGCVAVAIDGPWIAGNCTLPGVVSRAVAWRFGDDGWQLAALLAPLPDVDQSFVRALSGDLAVGSIANQGGFLTPAAAVAWRLPPAIARAGGGS